MLEELKREVLQANLDLPRHQLVQFTWGNASAIDRASGLVVIKASGIPYEELGLAHMVVVDLEGRVVEGQFRCSSDTPTHLALYQAWENIGGIVHTHSRCATAFAQAGQGIPCYGTTHADYFYGEIPCTRAMTESEIRSEYERNTATPIIEAFADQNPMEIPAVLVRNHGIFTWGIDAGDAVYHAVVLEEVARMALNSRLLNPTIKSLCQGILDRHYLRKHGARAYYGQERMDVQ